MLISQVKKAQVMYDPHTRESRGFGFVTMESSEEADAAITALNATDLMGKNITVEKVRLGARSIRPICSLYPPGPSRTCEDSYSWSVLRSSQAARL